MPETVLFSLKRVADLLDQDISQETIDREDSDLIRSLLERHRSLGTLMPDFRKLPTLANPVDDLRPLDLHRTLNVEDFFVKSAGLTASVRALSIESASLSARLYGLKLEIEELERQKRDLEKYLQEPEPDTNNPHPEPLADAMERDAVRSLRYSASEIANMREHVAHLRNQSASYHTFSPADTPVGARTYADKAIRYQRAIARAGNWTSEQPVDPMMQQDSGFDNVRDAAGFSALTLEEIQRNERRIEIQEEARNLESYANAAQALSQTHANDVERAKYGRAMLHSRLAGIEILLKARRALYLGKRGNPHDPQQPFDPACPDEIDILGRLHALSVRYAHERRLLRKYLMALLHAYRQVYNGKASPAVIGEWGRLLQSEEFFDHVDDVYLLLNEFELLLQRLATNARRTFVVREVALDSLPNTKQITFDPFELQDYPLAQIRGLSAALLADEGQLVVSFNTLRRQEQKLRSGEIPLVLPLALQPSPPVFATNDFWNEPLDSGWEIQVKSHSGAVQTPVRLLICWHVECADLQDLRV